MANDSQQIAALTALNTPGRKSPEEWAKQIAACLTDEALYAFVLVLDGDPTAFEETLVKLDGDRGFYRFEASAPEGWGRR